MKKITKEQWEHEVINSDKFVLLKFWAPWCGTCSMVAPLIDELVKEYDRKVNFVKVDVDQNPELASKYNIISIPTLAVFRNGKIVAQRITPSSRESYKAMIDKVISQ